MEPEPRDSESGAGASSSDGLPRAAVAKLVKERLPPHLRTKPDVAALLSEMAGARRPTLLPLPRPSLSPARHLGHAASATPLGRTDAASPWHVDTTSTEFRRRTGANRFSRRRIPADADERGEAPHAIEFSMCGGSERSKRDAPAANEDARGHGRRVRRCWEKGGPEHQGGGQRQRGVEAQQKGGVARPH